MLCGSMIYGFDQRAVSGCGCGTVRLESGACAPCFTCDLRTVSKRAGRCRSDMCGRRSGVGSISAAQQQHQDQSLRPLQLRKRQAAAAGAVAADRTTTPTTSRCSPGCVSQCTGCLHLLHLGRKVAGGSCCCVLHGACARHVGCSDLMCFQLVVCGHAVLG